MRFALLASIVGAVVGSIGCDGGAADQVLIFTRGLGHDEAVAAASVALPPRLADLGFTAEFTEDPAAFEPERLAHVRAVVFLCTYGDDLLDEPQRAAVEAFVTAGGGWLGLHSASATESTWPFYQQLVVASFAGHPAIQPATIDVVSPTHPAMRPIATPRWDAVDEWYNFSRDPGTVDGVEILATVDESTYTGGTMPSHHPVIWAHQLLGGRALYSAPGHSAARWDEPGYADHVTAAIAWVAD